MTSWLQQTSCLIWNVQAWVDNEVNPFHSLLIDFDVEGVSNRQCLIMTHIVISIGQFSGIPGSLLEMVFLLTAYNNAIKHCPIALYTPWHSSLCYVYSWLGPGEPYSFPMRELQSLSMKEDSVMCPQHGEEVALVMLAPDIVIGDLDSSFHIPRHQLVLNENEWVLEQ